MAFSAPSFNVLGVPVWNAGRDPRTDIPDAEIDLQFYVHSRMDVDQNYYGIPYNFLPALVVRTAKDAPIEENGWLQIDGARAAYYLIRFVEQVHLGFPNEYRMALLEQRPPPPIFNPNDMVPPL